MSKILPSDSRASKALDQLLGTFRTNLGRAKTLVEAQRAVGMSLPAVLAQNAELESGFQRTNFANNLPGYIGKVDEIVTDRVAQAIANHAFADLPDFVKRGGGSGSDEHIYFLYEDVISYWLAYPIYNKPDFETVTVYLNGSTLTFTITEANVKTHRDHIVGMCFATYAADTQGLKPASFYLSSSITGQNIDPAKIFECADLYRIPITEPSQRLKRPFIVMLKINGKYEPVYFAHASFMHGILAICKWFGLPAVGKDTVWTALMEYTRDLGERQIFIVNY